ncbi:MAG TPA: hypothetical protein VI072_18315 [Polyangiaceae bacterium]
MILSGASDEPTPASVLEALFDAHVQHDLAALRGDALCAHIETRVAAIFRWLQGVTWNELFTPQQIAGIVERNVIELKVSGGITELAGEMSRAVFSSTVSRKTPVEEIFPSASYDDFADKIMALDALRRELIHKVTQSPAVGKLAGRALARVLLDALSGSKVAELLRASGITSELEAKFFPHVGQELEERLSRLAEKHAPRLLKDSAQHLVEALDPDLLRDIADEVWDSTATLPLDEVTSGFSAQDLEDFVVLGYEHWLKFRKSAYFRGVSGEVIERLFAKYGQESLASVIADMGVSESMVSRELRAVLVPFVEQAERTGFLEQQIRARLEPFYRSSTAAALLLKRS